MSARSTDEFVYFRIDKTTNTFDCYETVKLKGPSRSDCSLVLNSVKPLRQNLTDTFVYIETTIENAFAFGHDIRIRLNIRHWSTISAYCRKNVRKRD